MNGPFQVAQATGVGNSNSNTPARTFRLTKPLGDQAVVINLGYDQKVKVDFSAIANEKITLVHVGDKLIILFDNKSKLIVEPFFDSRHDSSTLSIEVAPGREVSVGEFASLFPITTDQSQLLTLPAAGDGNAQATGANFSNSSVDSLSTGNPLDLLGQEVLGNFGLTPEQFAGTPFVAASAGFTVASTLLIHDESPDVQIGANDQAGALPSVFLQAGLIGWAQSVDPVVATTTVDFGTNGEGTVAYALTTASGAGFNGVASGLHATVTGNEIFLFTEGNLIVGRELNAGGAIAFALYLDPITLKLAVAQYGAVQHANDLDSNDITAIANVVFVQQIVTDGVGNVAVTGVSSTALGVAFLDDGPSISQGEGQGEGGGDYYTYIEPLELDETIGHGENPPNPATDTYNVASGEGESNPGLPNGTGDDTGVQTVTVKTNPDSLTEAIGKQSTPDDDGALAALFPLPIINFGTDGPAPGGGVSHDFAFILSGQAGTAATNLTATARVGTPLENLSDAARKIELFQVSDTIIEGRIVGDGNPATDDQYVAFRITLVDANLPSAHITVDQFFAIDHDASEFSDSQAPENPSEFDEQAFLHILDGDTLNLQMTTTVTDGDGDHVSAPVEIRLIDARSRFISFDDDGPTLTVSAAEGFGLTHDETLLPESGDDDILFTSVFNNVANRGYDADTLGFPVGYGQERGFRNRHRQCGLRHRRRGEIRCAGILSDPDGR
jgi:hypothetical protein